MAESLGLMSLERNRMRFCGGHSQLEVLQWLRAQNPPCPWDEGSCARAAEGGHLEVLQWLRARSPPCPWNEWSCARAASRSRLGVLQ